MFCEDNAFRKVHDVRPNNELGYRGLYFSNNDVKMFYDLFLKSWLLNERKC